MNPATLLEVGAVLAALAGLVLGADRLSRRFSLHPEVARKLLHFGAGACGLSLPWLFDSFLPVATLCAVAFVLLLWLRFGRERTSSIRSAIHGVGRRSVGDVSLPVAIALLWLLAAGDRAIYVTALGILTAADGSAALAAIRYGLSPYPTLDGQKTWEGSAVFFAVAFVTATASLLLLSTVDRVDVLLVVCIVAVVGTMVEATSWYGLDNLLIPVGTGLALRRCLHMESRLLLVELLVLLALAVVVFLGARHARLVVQARFGAMVVAFWVWTVGGAAWLAPGVMLLILHPLLVRLPAGTARAIDLRAVLSVASAALVWLGVAWSKTTACNEALYAYCVALAVHLVLTADLRQGERSGDAAVSWPRRALWALGSTAGVLGCWLLVAGLSTPALALAALAWPIVFAASRLFAALPVDRFTTRCYVLQASMALTASLLGFVPILLLEVAP